MAVLRPTVRTVDDTGLDEFARRLAVQVAAFDPQVVVGIARGGVGIAEAVARELGGSPRMVVVRSQRPGTRVKERPFTSQAIRALPQAVADVARWLEVEYREASFYARGRGSSSLGQDVRVVDPDALHDGVAGADRVLVVDDTLDSGQTMAGVVQVARRSVPRAEIRTAVIATTWRRPPLDPDYVLQPRLLLRLPSSFDA